MKIKTLAVAATAFLHLKGPDGAYLYEDGQKVGIEVYGPGSPEFAQVEERQSARTTKRMNDNELKLSLAPISERRAESTIDLADLTKAFHHIEAEGPNGEALTGRELIVAVYSDPSLGWIKEQVAKATVDWGKFAANSPTN